MTHATTVVEYNARRDAARAGISRISQIDDGVDFLRSPRQREALELRYGTYGLSIRRFMSWDEVAWNMDCHPESARRLGLRGLEAIARMRPRSAVSSVLKGMMQPRRRFDMNSHARVDEIYPGLFQSGVPNERRLAEWGIELVVDVSHQDVMWENPARRLLKADFHDSTAYIPDVDVMIGLATEAAEAVRAGVKTMIHCQMGWNRSGIVSGVTVWMLTGRAGHEVVGMIQKARPEALANGYFEKFVQSLPAVDGLSNEDAAAIVRSVASKFRTQSQAMPFPTAMVIGGSLVR